MGVFLVSFFTYLLNLFPDPELDLQLDPDPHENVCGSETLAGVTFLFFLWFHYFSSIFVSPRQIVRN